MVPRDTTAKWVRMLRRFVIRARIDYECSTSIAKFTPVTTIFFLLNKICDGGSSKEPFLKAATLSILIWAYPRETKTNNRNFKNAAILPSKVAYRWRACALIWPLCRPSVVTQQIEIPLYSITRAVAFQLLNSWQSEQFDSTFCNVFYAT